MEGRGLTLAAVSLLVILGLTFAALQRQSRTVLREGERNTRHLEVEDAALAVGGRVLRTQAIVRLVSEASPALEQTGGGSDERLDAYRRLDGLMRKLSREDPRLSSLRVVAGGVTLACYQAKPTVEPPLSPPRPEPIALRATGQSAGNVSLGVVAKGRAPVLQAATRTQGGLLILAEMNLAEEAAQCERAAAGGPWALVGDEGVLWPQGIEAPAPPRTRGRTVLEDDVVVSALTVTHSPWHLRVRAPISDQVGANQIPLILAALSAVLVVWLGVRGARAVDRQVALEESSRQERRLQAIFDAITNALVVIDANLNVTSANRVAVEELGRDLVGRPYEVAVCAQRVAETAPEIDSLRRIFASGEPRQVELTSPRGRVWQVAQYPIFAPDLKVLGVVEHARDVTQTRMLQSQLVQSEKLSTLGEMAAGIAHEINNPIGVVSMFAQLLSEEIREAQGDDAPALEKVALIEEQATNVGEIVKSLLSFARKSEGSKVRFDAKAALERAMKIVGHQKILGDVELAQEVPEGPLPILGDEGQLAQVILNLVVNASHAMSGAGKLTIRLGRRGPEDEPPPGRPFGQTDDAPQRIDVAISDTGSGIDPDELERIFEPFFTTKPAGKGTGLGLSVGFGIIRDHGGCMWVHSRPGEGTTFTLDLPLAAEDQA